MSGIIISTSKNTSKWLLQLTCCYGPIIPQTHPSMKLTNQNNSNGGLTSGLTYSVDVQSSVVEMNHCLSLLLVDLLLITDIALIITAGM